MTQEKEIDMIYTYTGTSHHRALVLWKYYMRLACRSSHIKKADRWLKLAKWAIDGDAAWKVRADAVSTF